MGEDAESSPAPARDDGSDWKLGGALIGAALVASLIILPYLIEILGATGKEVVVWELALSTVMDHLILSSIAICGGLTLGPKVGLGTPLISDYLSGKTGWASQVRPTLIAALIGGITVAVVLFLADPWLEPLMPPWPESARNAEIVAENMTPWKPLLASIAAGVTEEIVFRYGLMTLFVWLGVKLSRREALVASIVWIAIVLVAILFGLAHLTNVVELGIPITSGVVVYVILSNGIASVLFGWLYWRRGLEAAIFAHIVADVVDKVVIPLITTSLNIPN